MENENKWVRPWEMEKFDDLYNRDERFFSIIMKGALAWLNKNIVLYNKSINHFIFNTGSSYLYVESNNYTYNMKETSGEDTIYMKMPRCIVTMNDIQITPEELSNPFSRGVYERLKNNEILGFNAEIRRIPIEININLHYVLSNFNESVILMQELFDKILFQRYYNVSYLGQNILCSIEFPQSLKTEINKIDMTSAETNQKSIDLNLVICTNYPQINERTEAENTATMDTFTTNTIVEKNNMATDINKYKFE